MDDAEGTGETGSGDAGDGPETGSGDAGDGPETADDGRSIHPDAGATPVGRPVRALVCAEPDVDLAGTLRGATGITPVWVETVDAVCAELERAASDVDCLVLGQDLPEGTGLDALRRVDERWPDLPTLFVPAAGDEALAAAATRAGVTEYLPASATDRLVERVRSVAAPSASGVMAHDSVARALTEAYPDMVFVMDEEGRYLEVHTGDAPDELVHEDAEALVGQRYHEVFPEEKADEYMQRIRRVLAADEVVESEYTLRTERGERWYESRGTTIDRTVDGNEVVVYAVRDITERKERERQLAAQRDELDRIVGLTTLIEDVVAAIVEEATREDVERAVCERLAESDVYEIAWIGDGDGSETALLPRHVATDGTVREADGRVPVTDDAVAAALAADGVTELPAGALPTPPGVPSPDGAGLVVPLANAEHTYGYLLLAERATRPPGERETAALETLGAAVGFAIAGVRSRLLLSADARVELVVETSAPAATLPAVSAATGAALAVDGVVTAVGDATTLYVAVDGAAAGTVLDAALDEPGVADGRVVDGGDGGLVELRIRDESVTHLLTKLGGTVRTASASDGRGRIAVQFPADADHDAVLDRVRERFDGVCLVAKRDVEAAPGTGGAARSRLRDALTERQRTTLETAYHAGYYEWPRESDASEVADTLSVADATALYHLRHGHEAILGALFDAGLDD